MPDAAQRLSRKLQQSGKLPPKLRVAWAAAVLERLLNSFSRHFRKEYRQDEALELAWNYALKGDDEARRRQALMDSFPELEEKAAQEGYGREEVLASIHLLFEVDNPDGKSAVAAVEYGALAAVNLARYRKGYSLFAAVPKEFGKSVEPLFLQFAAECLGAAQKWGSKRIQRDFCSGISLDFEAVALKPKRPPDKRAPIHEVSGGE